MTLGEYETFAGFLFRRVEPDAAELDGAGAVLAKTRDELAALEPFDAERIEAALRALAEGLDLKPRQVSADSHRRHRVEDLARSLREHRAPRARRNARAPRRRSLPRRRRGGGPGRPGTPATRADELGRRPRKPAAVFALTRLNPRALTSAHPTSKR